MSNVFALVPAKDPALGKSRLASVLSDDERCALNASLARHTLECCITVFGCRHTLVVTSSQTIGDEARSLGIEIVKEGGADGLNAALALAAARALELGAGAAFVVPTDLARLSEASLRGALSSLPAAPGCLVVPDRRGEGTNLLGLAPVRAGVFAFGGASRARHLERAKQLGYAVSEYHDQALALDIDLPSDYELWRGG